MVYDLAVLFLSSFFVVFLLGFQSLNVNGGHRALACITSLGIAVCNYILYKLIPNKDLTLLEFGFYAAGGPIGILLSMEVHELIRSKKVTNSASKDPEKG